MHVYVTSRVISCLAGTFRKVLGCLRVELPQVKAHSSSEKDWAHLDEGPGPICHEWGVAVGSGAVQEAREPELPGGGSVGCECGV